MELLYNPDSKPEEEVKATFVARQWLVDEVVSLIRRQPDGAGVQHILIIAPRGMGKTTVLLMAKFAINEGNLSKRWHAVKFPEESYGVYDLADFWLEVLNIVAADTNDEQLQKQVEDLRSSFPGNNDLQEAALALIKDWRRKHKKRLVLLVDNIDMILEQINDERDEARLRDVLMNDGAMMIVGCAISFFDEARSYEKPLYNFFKTYDLAKLKFEQIQELLLRRAQLDGIQGFEETLKANKTRLRVLEYFTGGNPRLVLMLYRVVTQSDISEVSRGLEKLLDEVTPYFKAKVESLPAQLRKILDHLARVSSKTNEGLTPTEIAQAVRLTSNQVSSQLKRLSDMGYVRTANLRTRSSYYTLSEPLYAIWHQMRFGRDARERMRWLVNFLRAWYDAEEIGTESARLETRFREILSAGRTSEARDVLEHRRFLAEAMDDPFVRSRTIDAVVGGYLDIKDIERLKRDILSGVRLEDLSELTLSRLREANCISEKQADRARVSSPGSREGQRQADGVTNLLLGITAFIDEEEMERALLHLNLALESKLELDRRELQIAWECRGIVLGELERLEEALESFDEAIKIASDSAACWFNRSIALSELGRLEEALASVDRSLSIRPDDADVLCGHGFVLLKLGKYEEAIASYDRALAIKSDISDAWYYRADAFDRLGKPEEAIASIDRSLNINCESSNAWLARGIILNNANRTEEAIASLDKALKIEPDNHEAWLHRGFAFALLGKDAKALKSFARVLTLAPNLAAAWINQGLALSRQKKHEEALSSFEKALEIEPDSYVWYKRAELLQELGRYEEAIMSLEQAVDNKPDFCEAWHTRGVVLSRLGRYDEAIASFERALEGRSYEYEDSMMRPLVHLNKFLTLVTQGRSDSARHSWTDVVNSVRHSDNQKWYEILTVSLLGIAKGKNLRFVRQLIKDSDLEEQLFPVARGIDYLLGGDEALIEKLSPEVRGIVEEIVAKLRADTDQSEQPENNTTKSRRTLSVKKSRIGKSKTTPRSRTRRRL